MRANMRLLVLATLALAFSPTSAASHGECTAGMVTTVDAGVVILYLVEEASGSTMLFLEANGRPGVQCGGEDPDMRLL